MKKLKADILLKLHFKINMNDEDEIFKSVFLESDYFDESCGVIYCFGKVDDSFENVELAKTFFRLPHGNIYEFQQIDFLKDLAKEDNILDSESIHDQIREILIPTFLEKIGIIDADLNETLNDCVSNINEYVCMDQSKIAIGTNNLFIDSKIRKKMTKKGRSNIAVVFLRTVDCVDEHTEIKYKNGEDAVDKFLSIAEMVEKYEHIGIAFH